ncbi:MAG TPA: hypothetical protein VE870_12990 [Bacteroidales bacterium]|nr:hypothetical protein [Bacteroidales bacterium]
MSKPLLNADGAMRPVPYHTSKSDEVCRFLLFYCANKIGPRISELVQVLCPDIITAEESRLLDEIMTMGVFSDAEIEQAADAALQNTGNLFNRFLVTLFWEL